MPHRNSMQMVPFYSNEPRESIPWQPPSGFRGYRIFKTSFLSGHLVFIKFQ
ncbi:hypothetical protein BDN67DRAFT_962995 [Paxillus ammoniavirescens]|nr:hypothetical protein BDN67DRAFT_962995 [Paxillus ammoniavirescens]